MKFRHYLETITGVDVYPMASLLIFFIFFSALIIWAVKVNKQHIDRIKNMPLDNDNN